MLLFRAQLLSYLMYGKCFIIVSSSYIHVSINDIYMYSSVSALVAILTLLIFLFLSHILNLED